MEGGVGMVVVRRFLANSILLDDGNLDVAGVSLTPNPRIWYDLSSSVDRSNVTNPHDDCSLLRSAGWCDGRGFLPQFPPPSRPSLRCYQHMCFCLLL